MTELSASAPTLDATTKVQVIVNPNANQGAAKASWEALSSLAKAKLPLLQTNWTQDCGDATRLCRAALEQGAQLVIAFGGDGTVNEVLNGFVDSQGRNAYPDATLGVLAAGSGSDFQRMFGKAPPHAQLAAFLKGRARRVDYGLAQFQNEEGQDQLRAFLNIASTGLTGEVLHILKTQGGGGSATNRYLRATLRAIAGLRNHQTLVQVNQDPSTQKRLDMTLASIANGRYFGSGMEISPHSEVDDGQLRLLTACVPTRLKLLSLLAKVYRGKHLGATGVEYGPATQVDMRPVDPARKIHLELDGEMVGTLPGRFSLQAGALLLRTSGT